MPRAVVGSGYRGTVEQLSSAEREHVKEQNLHFIRAQNVSFVEAIVMYAQAFV